MESLVVPEIEVGGAAWVRESHVDQDGDGDDADQAGDHQVAADGLPAVLVERIEDGPLGFVRHVGHGLSQDHGTGSDDDGHEEGADLVQLHQAGVGQLESEECPGQTVEADVDHKTGIRQSEQGGLGVVDGDGLGINLLL